jgi:drug/metabolite transporter (DMT)-like permease
MASGSAPTGMPAPRGPLSVLASRTVRAELAVLAVTLVWGSTFVLMQESVRLMPPNRFLMVRFGLATLVLAALYGRRLLAAPRRDLLVGAGIGVVLYAGYAAQTSGLLYTTAARSGFVTGLAVVLVPLAALALLGQRPSRAAIAGVSLATVGLFLLSWPGWEGTTASMMTGDVMTLGAAVAFALQIVLVGKFAPAMDPMVLTTAQIAAVTLLSGAFSVGEPPSGVPPLWVWASLVFLGVVATAIAFAVQSKAQRFTTPTHVALIFAMEPVFAGIFAWLFTGELLSGRAMAGCILIMAGMITAEFQTS